MKTYREAEEYLNSFFNYEGKADTSLEKAEVFKLSRVKQLMDSLDIPIDRLKIIHIAGTKGKGSCAAFFAYILACTGYSVGVYTSPHFFDFRERIAVFSGNRPGKGKKRLIGKTRIVKILREFKPVIEEMYEKIKGFKTTFFEVYTAVAFKYFLEQKPDFVVLETGLGGRLDATNVVYPEISVITRVGRDHTQILGKRLKNIAREKAGIIKPGVPVVVSTQERRVLDEIEDTAIREKAPLFVAGKDFTVFNVRRNEEETVFDFKFGIEEETDLMIKLKGLFQVENASLALAGISVLKRKGIIEKLPEFRQGLRQAFIEGRFELLRRVPPVVLDVAHNEVSFGKLGRELNFYFPGKKIILVFAASRDKDVVGMLKEIHYDRIIFTAFNNPRSLSPREMKAMIREEAVLAGDVGQAIEKAVGFCDKDSVIVVSGSVFLVAEAKRLL